MNLKISISSNVNNKDWNITLSKNSAATTYQIPEWGEIYNKSFDSKSFFLTVENDTGEIIGQLQLLIHKKSYWSETNILSRFLGNNLNLRIILTWDYGPIIHDLAQQDEILSLMLTSIEKIAKDNNVTIIKGSLPPFQNRLSCKIFSDFNYQITNWQTYVTKLKNDSDTILQKLDKTTRYDIRKGEQNNLQFVIANKRSHLDEYEELKIKERQRIGQKVQSSSNFLDSHWDILCKNEHEKFLLVKYGENTIAGIQGLIFNGNFIQHGVANASIGKIFGGSFLTWNSIKWAMKNELNQYDMGSSNPNPKSEKEQGINFYKSKWSSEKFCYPIFIKVRNPIKAKISLLVKNPKLFLNKIKMSD